MTHGDLDDLYQQVILDHGKNPRNFRVLEDANRAAEGLNPLCGDHFNLFLKVDDGGVIRDISFQGQGCAISRASASLMTQAVKGKPVAEAAQLFDKVHALVTEGPEKVDPADLGKLAVLSGVCQFPTRVKCASLAWHTLKSALEGRATVSTE
ncbi:MAG TPA: SUF system NifU family Fe-S cluster assembly protein [Anaeromyxobacteraceae bacterium]|nr:SUF system NifU family Fe-S cluster assembly protein [Anaeromyxobacteraceae bacterium]